MKAIRPRHSQAVELRVLRKLCEEVDSPYSLKVYMLLRNEQYDDILEDTFRESCYTSADKLRGDYLIYSYLRKWKGWKSKVPTQQVALEAWKSSESACRETNAILRLWRKGLVGFLNPLTPAVIHTAARKISSVLGPLSLASVFRECRWGPGATVDFRRGTAPDQKHSEVLSVSRAALSFIKMEIEHDPAWSTLLLGVRPEGAYSLLPCNFRVIDHNRLVTVPKTYKTDRPISAEPTANSFLQQGVGRYIRSRLRKYGVDLNDQSINQKGALEAFQLRRATLDLSSASDTIARELVYELLPVDWALFLDRLRVPYTMLPSGELIRLEKFSGMGNAFTFELESLIFWAVCSSIDETVDVYGDDIICSAEHYGSIASVLSDLGFTVNHDKSFSEGSFYESCGRHFFAGIDVTPIFQKDVIGSTPSTIISAFNRVYRWSSGTYWRSLRVIRQVWSLPVSPQIPDFCTDDRGFLTNPTYLGDPDVHGSYRCRVYQFHTEVRRAVEGFNLSYKLRRFEHVTPDPKGNRDTVSTLKGKWRLGRAVISRFG